MRSWEKANPMKGGTGGPVNVTSGRHTSGNVGGAASPKGGAGSQMGPSIAKGYLVTGTGDTRPTGGKFAGANKAKMSKASKRGS